MSEREKPKSSKEEKKARRKAFIVGFGSVFDISGRATYNALRKDSPKPKSSEEVLRSSWEAVGDSLRKAMDQVDEQMKKEGKIFPEEKPKE
jgi:hypothetical protein